MAASADILESAFRRVSHDITQPIVSDPDIIARTEFICRSISNRACVRVLLASSLAKIHRPTVDIRKPYTEIGDADSYSGRTYDEKYVAPSLSNIICPVMPQPLFSYPRFAIEISR